MSLLRCVALSIALLAPALAPAQSPGASASAAEGTVLARVSVEGMKYVENIAVRVRRVGAKEDAFRLTGWSRGHDGFWSRYYEEDEKGSLDSRQAAGGEYEIHGFAASAGGWGGGRTFSAADRFSLRFKVEPGKAVYLGNVHLRFHGDEGISPDAAGRPGLIWMFLEGQKDLPFSVMVRDTREQDLAELPKGLSRDRVEIRLLQPPK